MGAEFESFFHEEEVPNVSAEIARLSASFPFGAGANPTEVPDLFYSYLPEQPRAWALCETYLEQAAWMFRPIKRDEIINDILAPTYRALKANQVGEDTENRVSPHKLAVLYLIFALGTLVDLTLEPCQS